MPDKSVFCRQFNAALCGEGDTNNDGYVTGAELGEFLQSTIVNYSKGGSILNTGKFGEFHDTNLTAPGILGLPIASKNPPETVCFDDFIVYANATAENVTK